MITLEGHLAKIRKIYKHKAELMQGLLDEKVCPNVSYNKVPGGLFYLGGASRKIQYA